MICRSSSSVAFKTSMFSLNIQHGLRKTSRRREFAVSSINADQAKKPYLNMIQKFCWPSLGQNSFKTDCGKVKNCPVLIGIKIWNFVMEYMVAASSGQERCNVACHKHQVHSFIIFTGSRIYHIWKDAISAETYIQVLEQQMLMMVLFFRGFDYVSKTMPNQILHLLLQNGFVVVETCSQTFPHICSLDATQW